MKSGPRISVIVIGWNMARELPRTLRSLSPLMQKNIDAAEYEILLIDNGSTEPFDPQSCMGWGGNISFYRFESGGQSPVAAINHGLALARGELTGVMIDGARMASPGLLGAVRDAALLHPRPVIGTLSFHIGPDVQMRSVQTGYDQATEDRLLASIGWEEDGYRLFDIAVLAGSSVDGWFILPAETNALFMPRQLWGEVGGFEPDFISPGGGLVNLDIWKRVVALPDSELIMLLGEATFHQIHGGVATNSATSRWPEFHEEYRKIRGENYTRPGRAPLLFGRIHEHMNRSLSVSKLPPD